MENIIRVACYIRVSTNEQKLHGFSLDAQKATLTKYAKDHDMKIIDWYCDEGVSGRKLIRQRHELQRMINDAKEHKFDSIIFIRLDRYFRSVPEYHECQKILDQYGITWTATEEKFDLSTANGRFWVNQKLSMSEYEAAITAERVNAINEYKVRNCQALTGSQRLGQGYIVKEIDGIKRVVKDPEKEEMVMDFINHFLTYQNKYHAMEFIKNRYDNVPSYSALSRLLHDTKLYGHYHGNPNYCEPYITKKEFDKMQEVLTRNIKRRKTKHEYIFSGLVLCPKCGKPMAGAVTCRDPYIQDGKKRYKRYYYYYRCSYSVIKKVCEHNLGIKEEKIEESLLLHFDQYVSSHIEITKIKNDKKKKRPSANKIKKVKSEMTRLNNMYRKSRINEIEYDKEYVKLEQQLKSLEHDQNQLEMKDISSYQSLLKSNWKDLYGALDKTSKQAFWRKYVKAIDIQDGIKPIFF